MTKSHKTTIVAQREWSAYGKSPHGLIFYRNKGSVENLRVQGLHLIAQHANTADADLDGVPSD